MFVFDNSSWDSWYLIGLFWPQWVLSLTSTSSISGYLTDKLVEVVADKTSWFHVILLHRSATCIAAFHLPVRSYIAHYIGFILCYRCWRGGAEGKWETCCWDFQLSSLWTAHWLNSISGGSSFSFSAIFSFHFILSFISRRKQTSSSSPETEDDPALIISLQQQLWLHPLLCSVLLNYVLTRHINSRRHKMTFLMLQTCCCLKES